MVHRWLKKKKKKGFEHPNLWRSRALRLDSCGLVSQELHMTWRTCFFFFIPCLIFSVKLIWWDMFLIYGYDFPLCAASAFHTLITTLHLSLHITGHIMPGNTCLVDYSWIEKFASYSDASGAFIFTNTFYFEFRIVKVMH